MKLHTTAKAIREQAKEIIGLGYCEAQALLSRENPFAYSSGYYGWNCDYYEVDGVVISTGYRPIGKSVKYEIVKKYEDKAEKIRMRNSGYAKKDGQIHALLVDFVKEVIA